MRCIDGRCIHPDAGPDAEVSCPTGKTGAYCKLCEVGYTGAACTGCSPEYDRVQLDKTQRCEFDPGSCLADHGWLIKGYLPPLKHAEDGHFRYSGAATAEPVVEDLLTGIAWRRCAEGQTWDVAGQRCQGTPWGEYRNSSVKLPASTCSGAYGGHSDWRVPEQDELESLISYDRRDPAYHEAAFPGLPKDVIGPPSCRTTSCSWPDATKDFFWTATVGDHKPWWGDAEAMVSLEDGTVDHLSVYIADATNKQYAQVLCARRARPTLTRRWKVEAQDGSTVRDLWTGQIWRRCARGRKWHVGEQVCKEPAARLTWSAARAACQKPWRLPSVRELAAIRKYCGKVPPRIDTAAFPVAKTDVAYWSDTPVSGEQGKVWLVRFDITSVEAGPTTGTHYVRCVRGTARSRP
jgi:hypothetical protein